MKNMVRENAMVELNVYPESKYTYCGDECKRFKWHGEVSSFRVLENAAAEMMCTMLDMEQVKELLVLYFDDGHTEVYNNAKCDLFIY